MAATKTSDDDAKSIIRWISSSANLPPGNSSDSSVYGYDDTATTFSLREWCATIPQDFIEREKQLAYLALGVAIVRGRSRQTESKALFALTDNELRRVWGLIKGALNSEGLARPLCSVSRSAQGFLAVPLCSLLKDGNIDELFRLHVWLPDGQRGVPGFAVHSHQSFARSWVLAGEGRDETFRVDLVSDPTVATYAKYALVWNDGKDTGTSYKTHQVSSTVRNTGVLVRATPTDSAIHTRGTSYSISAANFHTTEVSPDTLHATLFFFDSQRGFVQDASVLGPRDTESSVQVRDPAGATPAALAGMVDAMVM